MDVVLLAFRFWLKIDVPTALTAATAVPPHLWVGIWGNCAGRLQALSPVHLWNSKGKTGASCQVATKTAMPGTSSGRGASLRYNNPLCPHLECLKIRLLSKKSFRILDRM